MQKKRKDNQFIKHAYYQGGNTAFRTFVSENLVYPVAALENNIEGIVQLKIGIDHKGKVINVKLMKGIGHGCDKEAMRIIRLATYEVPANPKKMRVIFHKTVRIQFKKPPIKKEASNSPKGKKGSKAAPQGAGMQLNYEISQKKKSSAQVETDNKPSYNYTINFNS